VFVLVNELHGVSVFLRSYLTVTWSRNCTQTRTHSAVRTIHVTHPWNLLWSCLLRVNFGTSTSYVQCHPLIFCNVGLFAVCLCWPFTRPRNLDGVPSVVQLSASAFSKYWQVVLPVCNWNDTEIHFLWHLRPLCSRRNDQAARLRILQ
jgi:hypothetical protein